MKTRKHEKHEKQQGFILDSYSPEIMPLKFGSIRCSESVIPVDVAERERNVL